MSFRLEVCIANYRELFYNPTFFPMWGRNRRENHIFFQKKHLTNRESYVKLVWLMKDSVDAGVVQRPVQQPSKLWTWVRLPSPAPRFAPVAHPDRATAF